MANLFSFLFFFFFGLFPFGAEGWSELNFSASLPTDLLLRGSANIVSSENGSYISLAQTTEYRWVFYKKVVPLWISSVSNHALANFTTNFWFTISHIDGMVSGGGLAFFIAPFDMDPPADASGQWLGLFNRTSDGKLSNQIVAVEFDTFMNFPFDMDANHVGIDVNSVVSKVNISAGDARLDDGVLQHAWIDYDGVAKKLQLFFATTGRSRFFPQKPTKPILTYDIDLSQFLPQKVMIGFSASRELESTVSHYIHNWAFSSQYSWQINSDLLENPVHETNKRRHVSPLFVTACVAVVLATMVGFVLLLAWWRHGNTNKLKSRELDKHFAQGPQKFSYSLLRAATKNFSSDEMLGKGGFGQVYRGTLSASNETVAVKRVSQGSKQGEKEYISEVSIISKLRHRNLVQLHGWCHEKGQLLLVYEFLPNGSLDKHLFGEQKGGLNWERRYNITCDIASALLYLHEEWDQLVVHRDIKASNIMLDAEFTAKLGDFGLARVVERGGAASDTTMVAGTFGYLAPECVLTRKASSESDVFSFGAVCLEIACGRKAVDRSLEDHNWRLVEWVWDLYGKGKIFDAADAKLEGNFNGEEMERVLLVGLSCSHPDPKARLSIRQVVDILKMKSPLPPLPPSYPETVYTTCHAPVFALSSMFDRTFCTAENTWNIERV